MLWLRERFPIHARVRVCRRLIPDEEDCVGFCQMYDDGSFLIVVDCRDRIIHQVDTLMHEWAHALVWSNPSHSNRWGRQYARLLRAYDTDWE